MANPGDAALVLMLGKRKRRFSPGIFFIPGPFGKACCIIGDVPAGLVRAFALKESHKDLDTHFPAKGEQKAAKVKKKMLIFLVGRVVNAPAVQSLKSPAAAAAAAF